jgi:lipopolysaccharide export system permease protein
MTTLQRHLIGRLLVATLIAVTGVCIPLTVLALFHAVPPALLYSKSIWAILYGILPTEFYLALPAGLAIAATWWYHTLVSDNAVDVLYAAGCSPLAIVSPAIVVALLGTVLGFYLSCVVAPQGSARLYDLIFDFQHNLRPSILEAKKFYSLENNTRTIFFDHWLDGGNIGDVFLREAEEDGQEKVITADVGQFISAEQESYLYLTNGLVQTFKRNDSKPRMMQFDKFLVSFGLRGTTPPKRPWTGVAELGPVKFLSAFSSMKSEPRKLMQWAAEALRRFGAPFLTSAYALIGIGLVLLGVGNRQDTSSRINAICVFLMINHALIIFTAQAVVNWDVRSIWIVIFLIAMEMVAGIALVSASMFKAGWPSLERKQSYRS